MKAANTLVILSDEHQARALSIAGHSLVKTPNLDRLAARGTRFTNAVTPCPICVPARAAFATGLPVHECRYWDNSFGYDGRVRGWGHALQEAKIPVESIGKLHYQGRDLPTGFDVEHVPMYLYKGVGPIWGSIRDPLPERPTIKRMLGDHIGPGQSDYTRYDQSIADLAVDWIEGKGASLDRPWCLYVGFVAPHFPLVAPPEFYDLYPLDKLPAAKLHPKDGYKLHPWNQIHDDFWNHETMFEDETERRIAIAAYYGLVSWLDHNIGRLITALEKTRLADTTRVIYSSDHGENLGVRGLWGKSNLYRESVDVPLIMAGPDIGTGICTTPVSLLDISVTIPESVGLEVARALPGRPGRSLFCIMREPAAPERPVFSEYHAIGSDTGAFMLRRGRWKFHYYVRHRPELFDIETDPEELVDLASDPRHAKLMAELETELRRFCDPEAVDRAAKADQAALVERMGGLRAALDFGKVMHGATPAPKG
jgi:choline-sulfatase